MKYCVYCGHEIDLETNKCPYCYKDVSDNATIKVYHSNIKCIKCGSDNGDYEINAFNRGNIMCEEEIYTCKDCGRKFSDRNRLGSSFNNNFQIILGDNFKKIIKYLLTFGIVLFILIKLNFFSAIFDSGPTTYDYVQNCNGLQTIKLADIYHAYNNDKDTATEMYADKPFIFEGKIFRIDSDKTMLQIDSEEISPDIYVNKAEQYKLEKYKAGDTIRVCGIIKTKKTLIAVPIFVENATIIE